MIPKIIHQVWLKSSKVAPPIYLMKSWQTMNPMYKYHLWNEENISNLVCQQQLDWTIRFCKKVDIIRLEMLYQYGGIYADCDFLCLKPFDDLLDTPFFAGYQWVYAKGGGVICNALMGAEPRSPFVLSLLNEIKKLTKKQCESHAAVNFTGPYLLSRMWKSNQSGKIYPPYYFYPIQETDFNESGSLPLGWKELSKDSYALHFWAGRFTYNYIDSMRSL